MTALDEFSALTPEERKAKGVLYLQNERLSPQNIKTLAGYIAKDETPSSIIMNCNPMGKTSGIELAEAFRTNSTVKYLAINICALTPEVGKKFVDVLNTNNYLNGGTLDTAVPDYLCPLPPKYNNRLEPNDLQLIGKAFCRNTIREEILDSLKSIADGKDVKYIDISKIDGINMANLPDGIPKNHVINIIDRYKQDPTLKTDLKKKGVDIEKLEYACTQQDILRSDPLKKVTEPEYKSNVLGDYGMREMVGSFLDAEDAKKLSFTSNVKAKGKPQDTMKTHTAKSDTERSDTPQTTRETHAARAAAAAERRRDDAEKGKSR